MLLPNKQKNAVLNFTFLTALSEIFFFHKEQNAPHVIAVHLLLRKGIHLFFGLPVCHSFQVFSIVGTGCT